MALRDSFSGVAWLAGGSAGCGLDFAALERGWQVFSGVSCYRARLRMLGRVRELRVPNGIALTANSQFVHRKEGGDRGHACQPGSLIPPPLSLCTWGTQSCSPWASARRRRWYPCSVPIADSSPGWPA